MVTGYTIRKLDKGEEIPYSLLLLADETKEAIDRYIHQSDIILFEKDAKLVALYALYRLDSTSSEIMNIAVDEAYQGQGIGQILLADASDRARDLGYSYLIIGTANAGIKQLYIYQKAGFEIFDVKWNFIVENYPEPIVENGIACKHMIMLRRTL